MAKETREEFFKRLDSEGIAKVRSNQKTNVYLDPQLKVWAIEWVHLFEEAADRSRDATSAEQLALARAAAADAREATVIARSAKRIAINSAIITTIVAIFCAAVAVIVPHYWH
jgi:hypothetical protein